MDRAADQEERDRDRELTIKQQPWWGSLVPVGLTVATIATLMFVIWAADYELTVTSRSGTVYQYPWW